MKSKSTYILEFNRCRGDNINLLAQRFNRRGISTTRVPHRTTLRVERPPAMDWPTFKGEIRREIAPRIGSVLIHSQRTGKTFICQRKGHRGGRFKNV